MYQKTPAKRVLFRPCLRPAALVLVVVCLLMVSTFLGMLRSQRAIAASDSTINFQARLMDGSGAIVPDGTYNIEFKLYNTGTSSGSSQGSCSGDSACLWTETRTSTDKVRVANGYLTVNLGSVTAFPTTINWDQDLYLTLNIGGTGTPSWDGEMSPRLHLTAVPYAFRAGQLATLQGSNTSTLSFATQSAANSILLPDESGTLCIQNSSNCGFALSTGSANYIQNGTSPQTANFNITGSGVAGTLEAGTFDTASAGTLNIGTTNATSINIGQSGVDLINNGKLYNGSGLTIGSTSALSGNTGKLTVQSSNTGNITGVFRNYAGQTVDTLQAQDSTGACYWRVSQIGTTGSCNNTNTTGGTGSSGFKSGDVSGTGSGTTGDVNLKSGNNSGSSGNTGAVNIASGNASATGGGSGQVQIQTGTAASGITTGGISLLTGAASGGGSSGAVSIGSGNVTGAAASGNVSVDVGSGTTTGSVAIGTTNASAVTLGNAAGSLTLKGASSSSFVVTSGSFTSTLNFTAPTANRTISLPDESGTLCIQNSTNCGFAPTSGSANYIQNGTSPQTADFNITGTGTAGTLQATTFDTASSGVLSIGTTNATSISLNQNVTTASGKSLTVQGVLTQNSGAFNLNGTSTSTINVTGAFNINATGGSTWQTTSGDLTIKAAGSGKNLTLDDTASSGAINIGGTTNNVRTINVGVGSGGSQAQTVTIGSNGGSSTTTIQGGTGSGALSLTTGTNGSMNFTTAGTGSMNFTTNSSSSQFAFKSGTNSATAFQVQPSTGSTPVLDVDTSNSRVGIGTAAPSRTLDVAVNNTLTTAPMAMLEQAGTGDTTLELKSPSKSFILGLDGSDSSSFKISSSTASATATTMGYTTAGGSTDSGDNGTISCSKFTSGATAGTITSMSVNVASIVSAPNNQFQVGVYTDNGGSPSLPGTLVANSGSGTLTSANDWNTVSISASIAASTTYWLCYYTNGNNNLHYDNGASNQATWAAWGGSWPSTFGGTGHWGAQFSIYATYTTGSTYDSFNKSLFNLTDTGQATFQNSTNSTSAFQIQNSSSVSQLTVDTSHSRITLGTPGGDSTGTLLVLGNKTTSGDPTEVDGAIYYNSSTKSFRCGTNSTWHSCLNSLDFYNINPTSAISWTTTQTDFLNDTSSPTTKPVDYTMLANDCTPGVVYRLTANGIYNAPAATNKPSLKMSVDLDGTGTQLMQMPGYWNIPVTGSNDETGQLWQVQALITCDTSGASGTIEAQGTASMTADTGGTPWGLPNTGPVTINTTISHTLRVGFKWGGTNTSGDNILLRQIIVERLAP